MKRKSIIAEDELTFIGLRCKLAKIEGHKMNKVFGGAITAVAFVLAAPAQAIEISDMSVGDIACYDRFGPFNVIGRVVDLNRSSEEALLENDRGNREWYSADKFRNVNLCRLTGAALDWAIDQGVEGLSQ